MRALFLIAALCVATVQPQQWNQILSNWRKGKALPGTTFTIPLNTTTKQPTTTQQITNDPSTSTTNYPQTKTDKSQLLNTTQTQANTTPLASTSTQSPSTFNSNLTNLPTSSFTNPTGVSQPNPTFTTSVPKNTNTQSSSTLETSTITEGSTFYDGTTYDYTATTGEPREGPNSHEFYLSRTERPNLRITSNISQNLLPLPAGAGAALVKPTKYHYYPHNQHIYLLPECAIQQVCNAVYVRLNWTQPLCACPSRYRDPCSASLNSDDQHTTELMVNKKSKALTLVKTCEMTTEMRICRAPRDWSLLALQNIRTGKSHYLVICRCPDYSVLEGPMSHDQPTYASVPGIRVYGMMCVDNKRRGRLPRTLRSADKSLEGALFPWDKAVEFSRTVIWD